jgi:hypothetical protein
MQDRNWAAHGVIFDPTFAPISNSWNPQASFQVLYYIIVPFNITKDTIGFNSL